MNRSTIDRFIRGMVFGILLILVIGASAIFFYTRIIRSPGDVQSTINYMIYTPPVSHEEATEVAKKYYGDTTSVVREISLEGEHGLLFWEVVLEDDRFVAVDANAGHILFTGVDLEDEDDFFQEITEEVIEIFDEDDEDEDDDNEEHEDDKVYNGLSAVDRLVQQIQEAEIDLDKQIQELEDREEELEIREEELEEEEGDEEDEEWDEE